MYSSLEFAPAPQVSRRRASTFVGGLIERRRRRRGGEEAEGRILCKESGAPKSFAPSSPLTQISRRWSRGSFKNVTARNRERQLSHRYFALVGFMIAIRLVWCPVKERASLIGTGDQVRSFNYLLSEECLCERSEWKSRTTSVSSPVCPNERV